jgi:hypothetical protein
VFTLMFYIVYAYGKMMKVVALFYLLSGTAMRVP